MPINKRHYLELANFICRFGEKFVLLDMAEEIVIPAFFDDSAIRSFGETRSFFHQVSFIELSENPRVIGIVGRYVQDKEVGREQFYDEEKGLVQDPVAIRSAPSSIFVLILNNHKLLYFRETADAPGIESFRNMARFAIKKQYTRFVREKYTDERQNSTSKERAGETKNKIAEEFPMPTVEAIPIANEASLAEFIAQFNLLQTIRIKLVEPNDDPDNQKMFEYLRQDQHALNSNDTEILHRQAKGLQKQNAAKTLDVTVKQANVLVELSGIDTQGNRLSGTNEKFNIRVPISDVFEDTKSCAKVLYAKFLDLVRAKRVDEFATPEFAVDKITSIATTFGISDDK